MLHALSTAWIWLNAANYVIESAIFVVVMPLIIALGIAEAISDKRKKRERRRELAEMLQQPSEDVTSSGHADHLEHPADHVVAEF